MGQKGICHEQGVGCPLDQPRSYVYLILSRVTGKTYVGITGLSKLRKIIRRFKEHLFCARALKKLAKFDKRVRHPLSQSMSQMGQTPQVGHPTDGSLAPKQTANERASVDQGQGKGFQRQKNIWSGAQVAGPHGVPPRRALYGRKGA